MLPLIPKVWYVIYVRHLGLPLEPTSANLTKYRNYTVKIQPPKINMLTCLHLVISMLDSTFILHVWLARFLQQLFMWDYLKHKSVKRFPKNRKHNSHSVR